MLLSRKSYALTNSNNFWPSGKRLIQQLVLKLALIVFQNFRKWLDKTKLLLMVFTDENYPFWKVKMQIFLESIDRGIWDAILYGPFVPTITVNNLQEPKPFS